MINNEKKFYESATKSKLVPSKLTRQQLIRLVLHSSTFSSDKPIFSLFSMHVAKYKIIFVGIYGFGQAKNVSNC